MNFKLTKSNLIHKYTLQADLSDPAYAVEVSLIGVQPFTVKNTINQESSPLADLTLQQKGPEGIIYRDLRVTFTRPWQHSWANRITNTAQNDLKKNFVVCK